MGKKPLIQKKPKSEYRHGDLKNVLLKAAIQFINDRKEVSFTIRELAALAGVTHTAAYRHYKSKKDILAQIALEGFLQMQKYFDESAQTATSNNTSSLLELGKAYVYFAVDHPAHFRVMFHPDLNDMNEYEELCQVSRKTYETLVACVEMNKQNGRFIKTDTEQMALLAWSYVHGLSTLYINGKLNRAEEVRKQEVKSWAEGLAELLESGLLKRK